jgi:hypothetical protein
MTSARGSGSLSSFAPGGESNPAYIFFDVNSTSPISQEVAVALEPVRIEAFNLRDGDTITVEQVIHVDGVAVSSPFMPWRGPVTLNSQRTSILLDTAGFYRFVFSTTGDTAPGDFTLIGFPFTMTHELIWSVLAPLIPGLVEQLERVLAGLELKISPQPNNIIVRLPDGLYAERTFVEGGSGIEVTGFGSALDPYVVALKNRIETILGADTATVDMVVTETDPLLGPVTVTISANVKLSSRQGNMVFPDDDGIFVSRTFVSRGFGTEVTGTGTPGDPYVVSAPCCAQDGDIIGFLCIAPSIADPGTPGGFDSAPIRRPDVVLPATNTSLADLGGTIYLSLRDIRQNGGSGGPWLVDFSNVSATALLYEGLEPRATTVNVVGNQVQLIGADQVATMAYTMVALAYDLTKSGWASIRINAGSYVTVTQLNGPSSRKFYVPAGSEGFVGCGDFLYPQGGYSDSWNILTNADATFPRCLIAYAPSTDVPGDIILGGGNTELLDFDLNSQLLTSARVAARLWNFTEDDSITLNPPYAVNFDNVVASGFFQQITGGVVDRTRQVVDIFGPTSGLPGGPLSMTFAALEVVPDAVNYDESASGYGGIFFAPGSFALIQNGAGVVTPIYLPSGADGVAPVGTYLAPQGAYEDTFYITPSGTPPPSTLPVTFELFMVPSALDPSTPVTWPDIGPGTINTTPDEVTFGYLEVAPRNIAGGRPPYTIDFSNVQVSGYIRDVATGIDVGSAIATFFGGSSPSSSPIRDGVQSGQNVVLRVDPVFSQAYAFVPTKDYGIVMRVQGYVIIRDSGIGIEQRTAFHFIPQGKSEGNLVNSDLTLVADPSPGNFYVESYSYRGFVASETPISATICVSPSVSAPLNGSTGNLNITLTAGESQFPARGEVSLRVVASNVFSDISTQFTAQLKNDDNGEPFFVTLQNETAPGVLTNRAVALVREDSPVVGGAFSGGNPGIFFGAKLDALTGANAYNVTQVGVAAIGIRAGSYIEFNDGLRTEKLYIPGGNEFTTSCNGAPGQYADQFAITPFAAPPIPPVTAKLGITPSVGIPQGGNTQLVSPVNGPTIPAGSGAQALKAIGVQISDIAGGVGPYTVDFSNVSARAVSSVQANVFAPIANFCQDPAAPPQGTVVLASTQLCEYERITIRNDGFMLCQDDNGVQPDILLRWQSLGVSGVPLATQYQVLCTATGGGAVDPTDPLSGSSALGVWLDIPYTFPLNPPNQSVSPTWAADFQAAPFSVFNLQFRQKNTTTVLAAPAIRLNQPGSGDCTSGTPGGGGGGGGPAPIIPVDPFQFSVLLDGSDDFVGLVPASNVFNNVTAGPITRNYQMNLRTCSTWSDSLAIDLGIELTGFVTITDSVGRSAVLWIPNAIEGNVGITQITANPNGGYSDYYRYLGAQFQLTRPPQATSPPNKFGSLFLFGNGTVQGAPIYHDPINQQLGRWFPSGGSAANYSVRVTFLYGQTESGDTSPTGVWTTLGASQNLKFSAEDDQQRLPAGFKVEVRNLIGEITTWWFIVAVPSRTYNGPTISYTPIPNPFP